MAVHRRRDALVREYRAVPSLLKVYLAALMYDALDDLSGRADSSPVDLYRRFVSWTRSAAGNA